MKKTVGHDDMRDLFIFRQKAFFEGRIDLATGFPVRCFVSVDDGIRQHGLAEVFHLDMGFDDP